MKKILYLILVVSFFGCVSHKTAVKENIELDAVESVDLRVKETSNYSSRSDALKDEKTNVTDKTITTTTETEYSAPDADGKQYKTKETTTETRNDIVVENEEKTRVISEQQKIIEQLKKNNSELKTMLNMALDEKTKTATRVPIWVFIVLFVAGGLVALFLRKWVKMQFKI